MRRLEVLSLAAATGATPSLKRYTKTTIRLFLNLDYGNIVHVSITNAVNSSGIVATPRSLFLEQCLKTTRRRGQQDGNESRIRNWYIASKG